MLNVCGWNFFCMEEFIDITPLYNIFVLNPILLEYHSFYLWLGKNTKNKTLIGYWWGNSIFYYIIIILICTFEFHIKKHLIFWSINWDFLKSYFSLIMHWCKNVSERMFNYYSALSKYVPFFFFLLSTVKIYNYHKEKGHDQHAFVMYGGNSWQMALFCLSQAHVRVP